MKSALFLGVAAALLTTSAPAQFIEVRLSYKAVLNPANGQRPGNFTDAQIDQAVARMNELQTSYSRGFRFVRVDPVTNVGGQGDTTGPSRWYSTDFFDETNGLAWRDQMESLARGDGRYAWNHAAINLYITDGFSGGLCSFPGHEIIILGRGASAGNGPLHLHEIGHYFELCHSQGCFCGSCGGSDCASPGDDGIADTLPDLACWGRNEIANHSFGMAYADLPPSRQTLVDDVFLNIMSYHGGTSRLTELQLDRWTDAANGWRLNVTTGRTWFVDDDSCLLPAGHSACNPFGGPLWTVEAGVNAANPAGGDIVLIRPGTYNEPRTFSKPVTLRATRLGGVVIGQ
jgi:hypothetical protein